MVRQEVNALEKQDLFFVWHVVPQNGTVLDGLCGYFVRLWPQTFLCPVLYTFFEKLSLTLVEKKKQSENFLKPSKLCGRASPRRTLTNTFCLLRGA